MSKIKIGFMQGRLSPKVRNEIQAFPFLHWKKEFQLAKKLKIKKMEWTIDDYNFNQNPLMSALGRNQINLLRTKYNVSINSITCDFLMTNTFYKKKNFSKDNEAKFYNFLDNCKKMNIKLIVVPLVDKSSIKNKKEEKNVVSFYNNIENFLKKEKMKIAFESDFNFFKLKYFIDNFNPKTFGINYDIGNSAGLNYDYKKELASYHKRIINVHIKDKNKNNVTVPLFSGKAQILLVMKYLINNGYKGNFILQPARASFDHVNMIRNYKMIFEKHAF